MLKNFYFFYVLVCLLYPLHTKSQVAEDCFISRYSFSYLTMDEGLLHNNINHLYKDSRGFLWISTRGGGLSRYDGYDLVHFTTTTSPVALRSNFISKVCEDNFHRLWIVSDEGINILNLHTLKLHPAEEISPELATILSHPAGNLIRDRHGNIWLNNRHALYKIELNQEGGIAHISSMAAITNSTLWLAMEDIDEDGKIWIGNGNQVYKVHPENTNTLSPILVSPAIAIRKNAIIHTFCKKENEIWIGTHTGLYRYNRDQETCKYYATTEGMNRTLSHNYITDMLVNTDHQLVISTHRGLSIYNPVTDDFERVTKEETEAGRSLNSDFITCMLMDHELIWLGTDLGGINKLNADRLQTWNEMHQRDNPHSLSSNLINSIYEDDQGNLWVGTVEGGLNKRSQGSNEFIHFTTHTSAGLSHNTVSSIVTDNQNRLWVGTWGWGITILDLSHPAHRPLQYINPHTAPYQIDLIESLCYDSINEGMWIGANPGIFFYDLRTDELIQPFEPDITHKVYKALGSAIDSQGNLWIGSVENGLFIIDLHSRKRNKFKYRHLNHKLDQPDVKIKERITCVYKATDGTLWIGSDGNGIYKAAPSSNSPLRFTGYTSQHGLINNNIRGILEDNEGLIWISTNYGLSCFDPLRESFINYTRKDGLFQNQFYWNAFCKSKNGDLYFGGTKGLTTLRVPLKKSFPEKPFKVVFTRFRINHEEIVAGEKGLQSDISSTHKIRLHERDHSFSLEFSALDYSSHAKGTYSYRLLGFEKNWIDIPGHRRYVGYTNLPPGSYTFQVKYTTDGRAEENSMLSELQITVKPYFYKTPWFILLVLLVSAGIITWASLRRIRFLTKQKKLLYQLVEERTRELTEKNRKVERQKTQLVDMARKIQELTLDKLSFFTHITHEFRTPITLIMGPVTRALKLSTNPKVIEQLQLVEKNSAYLLDLVNQVMDFRKVESGKQEIIKTNANFPELMNALIHPFQVYASERNIRIQTLYHLPQPIFPLDRDAIQKIVTNLLSNAIKFTPDGGSIKVYAATFPGPDDTDKLYFCVSDSGIGIQQEELPKIFKRFYQSHNNRHFPVYGQSGTGIGLYLIHRIIKLYGGKITAHNNKTKGSSFRVILPIQSEQTKHSEAILRTPDSPQPMRTPVSRSAPSAAHPPTILVVEDNHDMRRYIHTILSETYQVLEAENGSVALNLLHSHPIDFILSDLMMPVMDGLELSEKVKQDFAISHIPFLMLTAKTSSDTRLQSYRMGVDEYLQKPFSEEFLLTRIENILENRKRYQQRFALHMEVHELQIEETSRDMQFMEKIMEVIRSNYRDSSYGSTDFINDLGISKSVLNKKMQSLTGQSIGQFIRNYRLHVAYELLKKNRSTRNRNVTEIAYEVGFNDPKYFTRCFTKRYQLTPSKILDPDLS